METTQQRTDRHGGNGQTVDQVDQVSSVVLMGLAIAGGAVALLILALIH